MTQLCHDVCVIVAAPVAFEIPPKDRRRLSEYIQNQPLERLAPTPRPDRRAVIRSSNPRRGNGDRSAAARLPVVDEASRCR